ncbi:MAG TPA: DciA family protein [Herbaspirillum sp.]|nr:DciA family protein [Herbaspirillum sp.]
MKYPSTFTPYRQGPSAAQLKRKPRDVTDFLQLDNVMAGLLPAITRMTALQKSCAAILPAMFKSCDAVNVEGEQLLLSVPNAALAAKLKQQLPKLQEHLSKDGWQIDTIRIKVQVGRNDVVPVARRKPTLPSLAVASFAKLNDTLEDSPRNQALKMALAGMMRRNSGGR